MILTLRKSILSAICLSLPLFLPVDRLPAQEISAVKGGLQGSITDGSGAAIPGATVTLVGQSDRRTVTTDDSGHYSVGGLTPGTYAVTAKREGFSSTQAKNVEVVIGRLSGFDLKLQVGTVTDTVEVDANSVEVETTSTAVGDNLSITFYSQVPVARNVGSLFYVAPGAVNSGGTGTSNPSIGGATGLENQYIIDGVNLTDVGYGGLGVFSPTYGSLGTGINLSFVQEVQVKTGALEPKYGRADGGVALIVTKTGGTQYHGALSAYAAPEIFSATQRYADNFGRTNVHGRIFSQPQYDAALELGGPVPIGVHRDKLFFFGAFNPSVNQFNYVAPTVPNFPNLASHGPFTNSITSYSWAGKLTYKPTEKVTIEGSAFGDPSKSNRGFGLANQDTFPKYPNINLANDSGFSSWDFGSRSEVVRLNATLTPTWTFDMAATAKQSHFTESNYANASLITDNTPVSFGAAQFVSQGLGFVQNPETHSYSFAINTEKLVKFGGTHSLSIGYEFDRGIYDLTKAYSGPSFAFPAVNNSGRATNAALAGQQTNAAFKLVQAPNDSTGATTCSMCPLFTPNAPGAKPIHVFLSQNRGLFSSPQANTGQSYHQIYGGDNWTVNRFITVNAGLRWEEEQLNGVVQQYVFNDNWSPRLGINVDPFGDRKSKIFFNFARYTQSLPNDAAIRELNQEQDVNRANFIPQADANGNAVLNQYGTVTPVLDAAHLISGNPAAGTGSGMAGQSISISGSTPELIAAGTKLNLEEEFMGGIERQFPGGFVVSARYVDRRLIRILEDMSGVSPEGANAGVTQNFLIGNPSPTADYFTNEQEITYAPGAAVPTQCQLDYGTSTRADGTVLGAACGVNPNSAGLPTPDGKPDGFAAPRRHYQAVEIEVNKSFSHNFLLRANYRYAKLYGNYEGLYRNDNGQSDPGVSSLFDFTQGVLNLLGGQFQPGYLNTDRRNVGNLYGSYLMPYRYVKNLTLGLGLRGESGTPITNLGAHPVYDNSGEIPLNGGRGALGRTASDTSLDIHTDYPIQIEKARLKLSWDMFNVTNSRKLVSVDQDSALNSTTPNVDFLKPLAFQRSFYARGSVRLEF